ncbi:MAG: hypothetical protein Kow00108_18350 [Calditrichia bacterium]
MKRWYTIILSAILMIVFASFAFGQTPATTYATDEASTCGTCHADKYNEFMKTGHPFKLNEVNGAPPVYPANTSPGVNTLPTGIDSWDELAYVIGGYGWKARFVKNNGYIFTDNDSAQYNLYGTEGVNQWVTYHLGELKKYDYNCFKCHTTGASPEGSWVQDSTGFGTFVFPGIRCQGCHGPALEHTTNPTGFHPPVAMVADSLEFNHCGECHQRGGKTNNIPASGNFIRHHEQYNEMKASAHGDGQGPDLTCASCHDLHVPNRYPQAASEGMSGIHTPCTTCHADKTVELTAGVEKPIDCEDCHMAKAAKSALGLQMGNGWMGDIPSHLWSINTNAVTREAMFTQDGGSVLLDQDGHGAVTLDFACLSCHQDKDVTWASGYAQGIHSKPLSVDGDKPELAVKYSLEQNYPNPFNPTTTIDFTIPRSVQVELFVFDVTGRKIKTLVNEHMNAGPHSVVWDGTNNHGETVASGIYFYQIKAGNYVKVRRMVFMK